MVSAEHILKSFLGDAWRLQNQAVELVEKIRFRATPKQVTELYQAIHTLKGSASMIPGGALIVEALHDLEGVLASKSAKEISKDPSWIPSALRSLQLSERELKRLEKEGVRASSSQVSENSSVYVFQCESGLYWFAQSQVTQILAPERIQEKPSAFLMGAWVPVLKTPQSQGPVGVALQLEQGVMVLRVQSVVGSQPLKEAKASGAKSGTEWINSWLAPVARPTKAA